MIDELTIQLPLSFVRDWIPEATLYVSRDLRVDRDEVGFMIADMMTLHGRPFKDDGTYFYVKLPAGNFEHEMVLESLAQWSEDMGFTADY
jgi:hypothetical protein